jgi:4-amino-4-deoxy-L-arabinose transferase-like glycosyltransferase
MADGLPRSPLACLPVFWGGSLFPGRPDSETRARLGSLLLLIIAPGILLYSSMGFLLLEPDESRYAQIPREMLDRGECVVPFLQGEPYLDKPPLMYWLVMLSYRVFGVSEMAARLVPAVAIHGTILLVYLLGRRSLGERAALFGAALLAVAPGFVSVGRLLILDGLLTFCVTLSILAAFEASRGDRLRWSWWLLAAAASGFGMLTKGPVVELLLAPPLWLYLRLTGGARIGPRAVLAFLGVALAINLPWYLAICIRAPEFARHFFVEHNLMRFLQPFDHIRPIWFYLPILLGGLFPGTLLLWGFVRFLLSGDPDRATRRPPALGFFLLAGGWCVTFFSLAGSKLPTYILPAYPLLALAFGVYVASLKHSRRKAVVAVTATTFVLLWLGHEFALPAYAKHRSPMNRPDLVARYCADPGQAVLCYPRACDSVAFYMKRHDLRHTRSKFSADLIRELQQKPRTVVLFTHRHSLEALRFSLPPNLRIVEVVSFRYHDGPALVNKLLGDTPWGLCDLVVIERR